MASVTQEPTRLWRGGLLVLALSSAILIAPLGHAQIYEWVDDAGVRHFTTSRESLPDTARAQANIFVAPRAKPPATAQAQTAAAEKPAANDHAHEAAEASFDAGWASGMRAAIAQLAPLRRPQPPVLIVNQPPPVIVQAPRADPSGIYYRSPYEGSVSVPFDHGRSLGLTRREQLRARIQAEHEFR